MQERSKLLLVDDNAANLAILEEIFSEGYDCRCASSGEEALEILKDFNAGTMLLDIMMPGIDGYEVCRRVRKSPELQHLKVIMVSAKAMVQERLKAYDVGANDYVVKPFDADELESKVRVFQRLRTAEEHNKLTNDIFTLLMHEVQAPLRCVKLSADILATEKRVSQDHIKRLSAVIVSSTKRLQGFFQKVQELSEARSGAWKLRMSHTNLNEILAETIQAARPEASERGIRITADYRSEVMVNADPRRVRIALDSVLNNAIRFSEDGGEVEVSTYDEEGCVQVAITDHGKGVSKELLPYLFTAFVDSETKRYCDGPGLSLALTREILSAHGGWIRAESDPGTRTCVTMSWPIEQAEREESSEVIDGQ